jgi:nifR3 family TIM-barrel protein
MIRGFWDSLKYPVIGLAPMDGVTDAAFRYMVDQYGPADIIFTEFTAVEGIDRGPPHILDAFIHHDTKTPTVAQIFGTDVEAFYKSTFIIAEMGFDGVDINMGCPDPSVSKRGAGAGLILQPKLAQEIVKACKRAAKDWAEGKKIEDVGLKPRTIWYVEAYKKQHGTAERRELPVSLKTRTGVQEVVVKDWISNLLEVEPANITLHGRTLKQLYSGLADWDQIAIAAELAHKTKTTLLGNGDVKTRTMAFERIKQYGVDGVLIGRAAIGNPWIFKGEDPTVATRFQAAIDHCRIFEKMTPDLHFLSLRKHLAWYAKGFEGASEVRGKLMQVTNADQVEEIVTAIRDSLPEHILASQSL